MGIEGNAGHCLYQRRIASGGESPVSVNEKVIIKGVSKRW